MTVDRSFDARPTRNASGRTTVRGGGAPPFDLLLVAHNLPGARRHPSSWPADATGDCRHATMNASAHVCPLSVYGFDRCVCLTASVCISVHVFVRLHVCLCCMLVCVACVYVYATRPRNDRSHDCRAKGGRWPRLFSGSRRNHIVWTMSEWPPQAARHSASDYACEPDTEACDKGISSSSPSLPAAQSAAAAEGSVYSFAEKYLHSPLALRAR